MKDKVICEKMDKCPLFNGFECYHSTPHYHIDNCYPADDSVCGCCRSIKEIRRLKLERIIKEC